MYQQTYKETNRIESGNQERDLKILNSICCNRYRFIKAEFIELQYNGVDYIGFLESNPLDVERYIFLDIKTSSKYKKRESFIFELYYKKNDSKYKSWSLQEPQNNNNPFLIAFLDEEQAVTINKRIMITVLKFLEQQKPHLIKEISEVDKKGNRVLKYIVRLRKDDKFFKMMKPNIYHKNKEGIFEKVSY